MTSSRKPSPASGGSSLGMSRASAHNRRRATFAVRSLTVVGAVGAIGGSAYLTAALVPAADASNGAANNSPTTAASAAPSTAAPAAVPTSLTATKRASGTRPVKKKVAARATAQSPTKPKATATTTAPVPVPAPPKHGPVAGSGSS